MTAHTSTLDRLKAHRTLGDAPLRELEWLEARGTLQQYRNGEVFNRKGVPVQRMIIVFSGRISIRVDRGAGAHTLIEWRDGDVTGLLPYSRGAASPSDAVAEADTEVLAVQREHFDELIRECPTVTAKLVHAMIDRARAFTSSDLRDEKLVSLGKLAAGLAHELNNPAAAARRAAKTLADAQVAAEDAARRLGAARLDDTQLAALDALRDACRATDPSDSAGRSGLERADREESLADWLRAHGASETCASALADTPVTLAELDRLAERVSGAALDASLRWLAAGCAVRTLAGTIETASGRISDLVDAVKGFTYMDQSRALESVDIRRGIAEAITMLGAKVRAKAAEVTIEIPADLPRALAVGAELNQVWLNLLDNALDAIGPRGAVRVSAYQERDRVVVEVVDNGSGIPQEILWRIFEPFYTTKGVGKGTGLGLDIVRRLLQRQRGGIDAESALGRTVFRVWLRAAEGRGEGDDAPPPARPSAVVGPHSD